MSGRLGAYDLAVTTETIIYTCPSSKLASVNVNICNRNGTDAIVRLGFLEGSLPLSNEDYIEYDFTIAANESLEKRGIVLIETQSLAVYSDIANVTAQVWGIEEDI